MRPVVSIIGHHDSGKTRLLTQLIPLFAERGYRVGAVKHAPHLSEIDAVDSDSRHQRSAGAERVLLLGETAAALFWNRDPDDDPRETIDRLFPDCDIVLVEGWKHGPFPKIEVYRRSPEIPREPLAGEIDVVAVVTDAPVALPDGVPVLSPRQPTALVEFIETNLW
jgi:molybdopterin-guanine dinucleotide biosynthesis protein B